MNRVELIAVGVVLWTFIGVLVFAQPDVPVLCSGPAMVTEGRSDDGDCVRQVAEATTALATAHAAQRSTWLVISAAGLVVAGALGMYSIWHSGWRSRSAS